MSGIIHTVFGRNPPPIPPPAIGSAYQGGYMAGQISYTGNSVPTHNLVISPAATGGSGQVWKTSDTASVDTGNWETGYENSVALYSAGHNAAIFCRNLTIGGYTDWYLGAMHELEIIFYNLAPGTGGGGPNNNAAGNPYAVPSRAGTNYTAGVPAQTTAAIFQSGGAQALSAMANWSSNNWGTTWGRYLSMHDGFSWGASKSSNNFPVRAIRKVVVGTAP